MTEQSLKSGNIILPNQETLLLNTWAHTKILKQIKMRNGISCTLAVPLK